MQSFNKGELSRSCSSLSQVRHNGSQDVAIIIDDYFFERSREPPCAEGRLTLSAGIVLVQCGRVQSSNHKQSFDAYPKAPHSHFAREP